MKQITLASAGFERYAKKTRRAEFLTQMDRVVPWGKLCALVLPVYPKAGDGRRPIELERMIRIHCLQHWFNLSDPAMEESLYDSVSMRRFAGIDLGSEPVPDETTICKFRHLLEAHDLGKRMFEEIGGHLQQCGFQVAKGTIVDATIISAPSSTKNKEKARDPEMCQTKKGNQWYFGMKAHIGTDSQSKLMHSVAFTAANVHDSQPLAHLLHGGETRVWGDAAYTGQTERIKQRAPNALDFTHHKGTRNNPLSTAEKAKNTTKSKVRAKVEHPFLIIKRIFGFAKVRYRGLMKNANRLFLTCALANLYMVRRRLLRLQRHSCAQ
jgi:IS5 family transposase